MNVFKILMGAVSIAFAAIYFIFFLQDYGYAPIFYVINILIALTCGIYLLFFNQKKNIVIEHGKLVVKKGSKRIKELDLSGKERVTQGIKSIKIKFRDFTETFIFSDFNKASVKKLKSLS